VRTRRGVFIGASRLGSMRRSRASSIQPRGAILAAHRSDAMSDPGIQPFIAVTDQDWFDYLASVVAGGVLDEVNFWSPQARRPMKAMSPGTPVFFRLEAPTRLHRGLRLLRALRGPRPRRGLGDLRREERRSRPAPILDASLRAARRSLRGRAPGGEQVTVEVNLEKTLSLVRAAGGDRAALESLVVGRH